MSSESGKLAVRGLLEWNCVMSRTVSDLITHFCLPDCLLACLLTSLTEPDVTAKSLERSSIYNSQDFRTNGVLTRNFVFFFSFLFFFVHRSSKFC